MARFIVRYLLEADGTVPKFISNGGYFPLDEELVGVSIDASKRRLPDSVKRLDRKQLKDRVGEVEADNFLREMGFHDYK